MFWIHESGQKVRIEPDSLKGAGQVVNTLLFGFSESQQQNYAERKSKSFVYANVVKLITGWRDKKTKKCIYRVGPWKDEGILLSFFFVLVKTSLNE